MTTVYKKDSKGAMRFLTIGAEGSELIQKSGIVGTASPVEHRKVCKGKNVGKVNETTPEMQAKIEARNLINKKLSEEYYKSPEEASTGTKVFPMLAKEFSKESKKINWELPVYLQPKLDGMRCLTVIKAGAITMLSRDGKQITTLPHVLEELGKIAKVYPDIILDGELYGHGLTFQDNMRLIKKTRPESVQIGYHIYDVVKDWDFKRRLYAIQQIHNAVHSNYDLKHIHLVPTTQVDFHSTEWLHGEYVEQGYEGTMIRHGLDGYKLNGRSSSLLKKKDFDDVALPVLDIVPAEARPEWGTPVLELNGKRFQSGVKLSHEERIKLLANKEEYIGKTAEIRYFGVSEDGVPRFPVLVGFRLDK